MFGHVILYTLLSFRTLFKTKFKTCIEEGFNQQRELCGRLCASAKRFSNLAGQMHTKSYEIIIFNILWKILSVSP